MFGVSMKGFSLRHTRSSIIKFKHSAVALAISFSLVFINTAGAVAALPYTRPSTQQWNMCRYELAQQGYSAQKQHDFCRLPSSDQWTCAQIVLKKYHSLELAKETCLSARASEVTCFNQVLNRNFDPYVAKRVCKLK